MTDETNTPDNIISLVNSTQQESTEDDQDTKDYERFKRFITISYFSDEDDVVTETYEGIFSSYTGFISVLDGLSPESLQSPIISINKDRVVKVLTEKTLDETPQTPTH